MHSPDETIAAQATAPGEGALAVLRISGAQAREALESLLAPDFRPESLQPRVLHAVVLRDRQGRELDEVLAAWMPGPRSYTGEDLVELSTHGSPLIVGAILAELYGRGIKPAHPGEFTYRAYLNGRLDLVQAEAVAELIHSPSDEARSLAMSHLTGKMSRRLQTVSAKILGLLRDLEAGIDFVEEDIDFVSPETMRRELAALRDEVAALLDGAREGRLIREGVDLVLAGQPNVGKSSLFNRLLDVDRAIVTDAPGTTRDILRESWIHRGLVFHLHDTAGLRPAESEVERLGVARTEDALRRALIGLWLVDGSRPPGEEERRRLSTLDPRRDLLAVNKADLPGFDAVPYRAALHSDVPLLPVSALSGEGLDALAEALFELAAGKPGQESLARDLAVNRRQEARLREVWSALASVDPPGSAMEPLEPELLARQLREALAELEELRGTHVGEKVLEEIFANFCVGK